MSDGGRAVSLGRVSTAVSLVVELVDDYTGRAPVDPPRVGLKGGGAAPVHTPSDYHVFTDLDGDPVTVAVGGGDAYLPERREGVATIDRATVDAPVDPDDPLSIPLLRVELTPSPAYSFPSGATLLRGTVRDSGGDGVSGAEVSVRDHEASTRTIATGEFVLVFVGLTGADVRTDGDRRLVTVDGGDPIVEIDHADHGTTSESVEVEEGTTIAVTIAYS